MKAEQDSVRVNRVLDPIEQSGAQRKPRAAGLGFEFNERAAHAAHHLNRALATIEQRSLLGGLQPRKLLPVSRRQFRAKLVSLAQTGGQAAGAILLNRLEG